METALFKPISIEYYVFYVKMVLSIQYLYVFNVLPSPQTGQIMSHKFF